MICFASVPKRPAPPAWQKGFLALVPAIRRHARFAFRGLPPGLRQDRVEEVVAFALVAYVRLVELDKLDLAYPSVLARYAIAQIRAERRVGSPTNSRDVYSQKAQRAGGFQLERVDHFDREDGAWHEAIVEDSRTPVPDQAAFRVDFPAWLGTHSARQRRIVLALVTGQKTQEVARKFRVSSGRISQLRRQFHLSWLAFHGEIPRKPAGDP